jgi:hypothetical protein
MAETVTWLVEAAVGLACLAIGWAAWRGRGPRAVAIVFGVAGAAAFGHAAIALAT